MNLAKRIKIYLSIIAVLIIASFVASYFYSSNKNNSNKQNYNHNYQLSKKDKAICKSYNIPDNLCSESVQLGMYCPSWNTKAGQYSSDICIKIRKF